MSADVLDFARNAMASLQAFLWPDAREFTIPVYFDYFATFTWAVSGALIGVYRRYDLVGVFVIALISAAGGGLLRDGIVLQRTPAFLTNGIYVILVTAATTAVALSAQKRLLRAKWTTVNRLVELIDTVGVPAYAVIGMQLATAYELATPGIVLVGVLNGVGGGVLRDVLANEPALLLLPGQYTTLVLLLACVVFVVLTRWSGIAPTPAGLAAMALYFVIRALTIRYNWRTRPLLSEVLDEQH